ncbi:MAG: hypothetical protein BIFFINMI_03302 [Phycisphaerae bacterium]|nr:hypothetical protein [Phycisphaerae bacterium]
MIDEADNQEPDEPDTHEQLLWLMLNGASEQWTTVNLDEATATQSGAFLQLVLSGQIELRLRVLARGLPTEPEVNVVCIVMGDYKQKLVDAIQAAVPEFTSRVVAYPQRTVEFRLSAAGTATQKEIRLFGGGEYEESFLATAIGFTIPGVVNIHELQYVRRELAAAPLAQAPADPSAANKERRDPPAWPGREVDHHVAAHLRANRQEYLAMAQDVLDYVDGAQQRFEGRFGCTPIAAAITENVGDKRRRPCGKRDVQKTAAYRREVMPLLAPKPGRPKNFDDLLAGREWGESPDVRDSIPFAGDDS